MPMFEHVLGSLDLRLEDGIWIRGAFLTDGLDAARGRLATLSAADLQRQLALIEASVHANAYRMTGRPLNARHTDQPLTTARGIRDELARAAERGPDGSVNWLTTSALGDATRIQLSMVPPGLYDGRAGIAAFLYSLGDGRLAHDTIAPVIDRLSADEDGERSRYLRHLGPGLVGVGGLLRFFMFAESVAPTDRNWPELTAAVTGELTEAMILRESRMDMLGGLAGLARPLALLRHRWAENRADVRLLEAIGDRLLETQDADLGAWRTPMGVRPLTGWSHGASGTALALVEIHAATGRDRFLRAALTALAYEATQFDAQQAGWLDLRLSAGAGQGRPIMHSWCHGSVGIALARDRLLELLPAHAAADTWQAELERAVEGTLGAPQMTIDNLCCGNLGRFAVIGYIGERRGRPDWVERAVALRDRSLEVRGDNPFPRIGPRGLGGITAPGLMTGLAGVGLCLLRGSDTSWVGSLLL